MDIIPRCEDVIRQTLENLPGDWLRLTTHRLDIYNEKLAKVEFLKKFEQIEQISSEHLSQLPTAFDYIRLGHPLSCVLEWVLAKSSGLHADQVVSFSSQVMPLMAVLRRNQVLNKKTRLMTTGQLPRGFDLKLIQSVYEYDLEILELDDFSSAASFEGSSITINSGDREAGDFDIQLYDQLGSVIRIFESDTDYIQEILHVRRRESIAMTPHNCLRVLKSYIGEEPEESLTSETSNLEKIIQSITQTSSAVPVGSSGLSMQYAIMMGLIHYANENYAGKSIRFIVPPNCYGGTNDQARRVSASVSHVEIIDLPVDSGNDMVTELEKILEVAASSDAVPFVIAEIPTNPRVEIPDLENLRQTLKTPRVTADGSPATSPVFILDQTFCPNVVFFGDQGYLHDVEAMSYVSGSKFPSGGLCTAGYVTFNNSAQKYQLPIAQHLKACDNQATALQINILNDEMPSMNTRIARAYENTRAFVDFIQEHMPEAKINFVSRELAEAGFTPSVFSLDFPSRGASLKEKDQYKQKLNHKLIRMMIEMIPEESKHCVSYGQLKGCYWTIPATSTQGTTKESDKDYIVRVSVGAEFNLDKHCEVFKKFLDQMKT